MSSTNTPAVTTTADSSERARGRVDSVPPDREHDHPRLEPWLKVMLSATLPTIIALALPPAFDVPMLSATALLFLASMVMFVRRSRSSAAPRL